MAQLLLLVEDDPVLAEVLLDTLSQAGFEVHVAHSGFQALDEIHSPEVFDAIVTDIKLGYGPEGWEVAQDARDENPASVIVYMTGYREADHRQKSLPLSTMLEKPFNPDDLIEALSRLINSN